MGVSSFLLDLPDNQHDCARKKHIFYPKTTTKEQKGMMGRKTKVETNTIGVKSPRS